MYKLVFKRNPLHCIFDVLITILLIVCLISFLYYDIPTNTKYLLVIGLMFLNLTNVLFYVFITKRVETLAEIALCLMDCETKRRLLEEACLNELKKNQKDYKKQIDDQIRNEN